ncbi:LAETG motif-containing sortase-dependent surface protein [Streptomyces rectiviolaceus]
MATAGLAAGALGAAAVPAAADVIEPFAKRYDESPYGDFRTTGNTVMGCPTTPADRAARCATAADGEAKEKERKQPPVKITNVPAQRAAPVCSSVKNTITIKNPSGSTRTGATASWQVTPGSKPVASSGTVTEQGSKYVWKGDVRPHGEVTVTQQVKVSCTAGQVRVSTVTAPGSNCPRSAPGGDDPCTSAVLAQRVQARPAPQEPRSGPVGRADGPGQLAETGSNSDTMLYAGLAIALCALGALAVAAARSRRD